MGRIFLILLIFSFTNTSFCQENSVSEKDSKKKKILIGIISGAGWAYEDKAHLFNISAGLSIDYHIKSDYYVQFAPKYSWLWKWNEHYLTLPIHIRKKIYGRFSVFAGPALTFDIGYFKDLGVSAGAYYHFSKKSAIVLSAFTFTLYDYNIDYLYVPVSLSYNYTF